MRTNFINLSLLLMVVVAAPTITRAQLQPIATRELRIGFVSPTTNYISLQAPAVTTNYTLLLPATTGANGQVLITNGSGTLSWSDPVGFPYIYQGTNFTNSMVLGQGTTGTRANNLTANTGLGIGALASLTGSANANHGTLNTALGYKALNVLTRGYFNTMVGAYAGENMSDASNVHVSNTAIGAEAMRDVGTFESSSNVAIGVSALRKGAQAAGTFQNVAVGWNALGELTGGINNIALGRAAGASTASGANASASGSIFIGRDTKASASGNSNEIVIGDNATGLGSNTILLGNSSIVTTALRGNVLINNSGSSAGQVRFLEGSSGADYVAIQSPASLAAPYTLTLPADDGDANQVLTTNGSGVMSWSTINGLQYFTETLHTAAPNNTVNVVQWQPATGTNVDVVISPRGTGALMARVPDGAEAGGNKRGDRAVDWQMDRSNSAHVASGGRATIGGGQSNTASGFGATVSGGSANTATGQTSTVAGGTLNNATGNFSSVLGGYALTLSGAGSVGYNAGDLNTNRFMSVSAPDVMVLGNANLWLANNDNTARELRFYEAQSTTGAFPAAGTNYTAFKAGAQSADVTYTLPTAAPTTAGQVLSSTTGGVMSWVTPSTGWALTGNAGTTGTDPNQTAALGLGSALGSTAYVGSSDARRFYLGTSGRNRGYFESTGHLKLQGPVSIDNLSSTAGTTLPAGYDRVLVGNASGQIEEVGFTAFADATNTGWGINGNTTAAGTYAPSLNGQTTQFVNGDRGPWVGTRNAQPLWFGTNNIYRAQLAVDGTFTMSGPLVIDNLNSTAAATISAGYDRVLIANNTGRVEEVSFATFADATNTSWGINGNTTAAGTYAPSLNGQTTQFVNGDRGPWVGTRNAQPLWFGTNNIYRAQLAVDGTFTMTGPLVIDNLNSTATATISAGYDRVLIANSSGRVEEVSFATFASASASGWGTTGNEPAAGTYAPSLGGNTTQFVNGDRGSWIGTRNARDLWFGTNNVYRAVIRSTGELALSGQAQFPAGTAAAPSVSREGDADNGMFFPAANTLAFSTGGTERMRITDVGRVGIANAAPGYTLDVTGDINASANVRAGGTALTSDARLKRNITPIDSAIVMVTRLRPVSYEKKASLQDTTYQWRQMGFIAQELQTVLPQLVQTAPDENGTMAVDYTSLIALLTSAVQEQQSVIQDQGQRIRYLTAVIKMLEFRLSQLESRK